MAFYKNTRSANSLIALLLAHSAASAQEVVVVTYAPAAVAPVPTLSEWAVILMVALIAIGAITSLRKHINSKTIAGITLATGLYLAGTGQLVSNALALVAPEPTDLFMVIQTGGTVSSSPGPFFTKVINQTTVPMKILQITPASAIDPTPGGCVAGSTIVQPGAFCNVLTSNGLEPV